MTKYGILKVGKKPLKISTYFNDDSLNDRNHCIKTVKMMTKDDEKLKTK